MMFAVRLLHSRHIVCFSNLCLHFNSYSYLRELFEEDSPESSESLSSSSAESRATIAGLVIKLW